MNRTNWSTKSPDRMLRRFGDKERHAVCEATAAGLLSWRVSGSGHLEFRATVGGTRLSISMSNPNDPVYGARIRTFLRRVTPEKEKQ